MRECVFAIWCNFTSKQVLAELCHTLVSIHRAWHSCHVWCNSSHGTLLQIAATLVEIIFWGNCLIYFKRLGIPSIDHYVLMYSPLCFTASFVYLSALPKVQPTGGGRTSFLDHTTCRPVNYEPIYKTVLRFPCWFSTQTRISFYIGYQLRICKSPITKSTIKKNKQTYFCT